jgi:glycosyltransferase involved in cell wall biosynthesis
MTQPLVDQREAAPRFTATAGLSAPNAAARTDVLHIIAPGEIGGAESVVRLLASTQRSLGARVAVAAVTQSEREAASLFTSLGDSAVDTYRIVIGGRDYGRERRAIRAICESFKPDVVHSHGYRTDVVDALYVRNSMPIVTTVHGFTGGNLRNRFYQWLQCRAYRRFDAVVVVSDPLSRQLRTRIGWKHLHLVPNAYAPEPHALPRAAARESLRVPNDALVIGWVGRLSPEKGADVLLHALADAEMPRGARAVFVGDGPLAPTLREQAIRLGVDGRTSWMGSVPKAGRLFWAFDVLVVSSRTEGTPMVVLEAMAAETPIVATRVGGVPDMLPPDAAILVAPESPSDLAKAIRDALTDRTAAMSRARAARKRLDDAYRMDVWVDRYEHIYHHARARAVQRLS